MKVNINSDDEIIVFLNKSYVSELNFVDRQKIENYFKDLFRKFKKIYNLEMNGFYNINVYIDKYYGYILEISKEDIDYYSYFGNQIDMKINLIKNNVFLYEIDYFYLDSNLLKQGTMYRNGKSLYLKLNSFIDDITFGRLLERSNVIYGDLSQRILRDSQEVRI